MHALTIINSTLSRKLPQVAITPQHVGNVKHHTMPNKLIIGSSQEVIYIEVTILQAHRYTWYSNNYVHFIMYMHMCIPALERTFSVVPGKENVRRKIDDLENLALSPLIFAMTLFSDLHYQDPHKHYSTCTCMFTFLTTCFTTDDSLLEGPVSTIWHWYHINFLVRSDFTIWLLWYIYTYNVYILRTN